MNIKLFNFILFIFLFYVLHLPEINSVVTSSSKITSCLKSGEDGLKCDKKISLDIAINSEDSVNIQTISSITDENGKTSQLENPLEVIVNTSPGYNLYTLKFMQIVNYSPYEISKSFEVPIISQPNHESFCLPQLDEAGNIVPYSSGKICVCNIQVAKKLSKHNAKNRFPSNRCSKFLNPLNYFFSGAPRIYQVNCMRYNQLWYGAFRIVKTQYDMTVNVTVRDSKTKKVIENFTVDPKNPVENKMNSKKLKLKAILYNIVQKYGHNAISNKVLLLPLYPLDHKNVENPEKYSLLVDELDIDTQHSSLKKISPNDHAYCNSESDFCFNVPEIINQIKDKIESDRIRIENGEAPKFLLKKDFKLVFGSMKSLEERKALDKIERKKWEKLIQQKFPGLTLEQIKRFIPSYWIYGETLKLSELVDFGFKQETPNLQSNLVLDIVADDLKIVNNLANAKIKSIVLPKFEVSSEDGVADINIENIDNIDGQYLLQFLCPASLRDFITIDPPSRTFSIQSKSTFQTSFHVTRHKIGNIQCSVYLWSSEKDKLFDQKTVTLETTQLKNDQPIKNITQSENNSGSDFFANGILNFLKSLGLDFTKLFECLSFDIFFSNQAWTQIWTCLSEKNEFWNLIKLGIIIIVFILTILVALGIVIFFLSPPGQSVLLCLLKTCKKFRKRTKKSKKKKSKKKYFRELESETESESESEYESENDEP